jgi:ATP-dependent helicase/nuclease subunit A
MSMSPAGPPPRTGEQRLAADPARHVWVAASAGTGKTYVLTDRILRLLLEGCAPDRILALTFTRAAAAEMQNRLVARLGAWQGFDDARLVAEFEAMGVSLTPERLARARTLFALALDVPGGLKVQTLHAFAQGLLAAFPLEAGLPPGFRALAERDSRRLRRQALADCIADAEARGDRAWLDDLAELAVLKGEGGVMQALDAMIAHGEALLRFTDRRGPEAAVRRWLGVGPDEKPGERLRHLLAPGRFDELPFIAFAQALESWGWKKPREQALATRHWLSLDADARAANIEMLRNLLFDSNNKLRSFRQGETAVPGIQAMAEALSRIVDELLDIDRQLETAELAGRALRAGHPVVARYQALKRAALAIDYDDMIAETVALLGPEGRPGYVNWKLDSRFDHVLVDEAQDTNEPQWAIIAKLVEDWFSAEAEKRRSLFVVGDHKQAIYGFQGTDPRIFEGWRQRLSPQAAAAGRPIEGVDLDLSFRSGPAVLDVVNRFLQESGPEALGMAALPPPHRPHRAEAAGEVVLWPVIIPAPEDDEPADESDDGEGNGAAGNGLDDRAEAADLAMAKWLAAKVAGWLQEDGPDQLWLPARGRWAEPGDILILLRKRSWLMGALVGELHEAGVKVAGVDRLLLTEPLAVLDALALVRFAVQPEDDLTLASLLVSPFLGWTHEAVRALGGGRPGLWAALGRAAAGGGAAAEARAWLGQVLALADTGGPYRFLDLILSGPLQGRRRLLARLGAQANDPLDELLQQALAYEADHPPALAGFLAWVEAEGSEVKRDAEAASGQVRLMTIHGAKGLEAPVVVLADAAHQRRRSQDGYIRIETENGALPLFHPGAKARPRQVQAALDASQARDREEDLRLLYVGLTRAADHLFIGGAISRRRLPKLEAGTLDCWHTRLAPVLEKIPGVERIETTQGLLLRHRAGRWSDPVPGNAGIAAASGRLPISDVLTTPAPPLGRPARPLTPSALPDDPPAGPPPAELRAMALRGDRLHRLFERLPAVAPANRAAIAHRWLAAQQVPPTEAEALVAEALAVIEAPDHAALFGPDALAEAPIAGLVEGRAIAGIVDRLLVEEARVLVVDFKTGLKVPASPDAVPMPHRRQMAAYAAVLRQAFPGRRVEAALLFTSAPKFLLLPGKMLEGALALD